MPQHSYILVVLKQDVRPYSFPSNIYIYHFWFHFYEIVMRNMFSCEIDKITICLRKFAGYYKCCNNIALANIMSIHFKEKVVTFIKMYIFQYTIKQTRNIWIKLIPNNTTLYLWYLIHDNQMLFLAIMTNYRRVKQIHNPIPFYPVSTYVPSKCVNSTKL